jgi:hypothetical protein
MPSRWAIRVSVGVEALTRFHRDGDVRPGRDDAGLNALDVRRQDAGERRAEPVLLLTARVEAPAGLLVLTSAPTTASRIPQLMTERPHLLDDKSALFTLLAQCSTVAASE